MLSVRMLGGFEVFLDQERVEIPSHPAQSLLAYLLLNPNQDHPREKLACMFWPDASAVHSRGNLRNALWRIRKSMPSVNSDSYISSDDFMVRIQLEHSDWVDVTELAAEGSTTADLQRQTALYKGEFLPGFYEEWVILERERLQMLFSRKMDVLLRQLIYQKAWQSVQEQAEVWIGKDYAQELPYRYLMLAQTEQQNPNEAVKIFHRCEESLRTAIGLDPSEATRRLYQGILELEPTIDLIKTALGNVSQSPEVLLKDHGNLQESAAGTTRSDQEPDPGIPPYKGLASYEEEDAPLFFGRSSLCAKLLARLDDSEGSSNKFLGIVGASGSGKSSLVQAGLIPALRRSQAAGAERKIVTLTPNDHPLESLAKALSAGSPAESQSLAARLAASQAALYQWMQENTEGAPAGGIGGWIIVVDQFEELFTLCQDEDERNQFIDNLLHVCSNGDMRDDCNASVILALRADYYAQCGRFAKLREALAANQEYIGPMNAIELREVIEKPAVQGGWQFEYGLVELILREIGSEAGRLPLLSHALLETWKRRTGRNLSIAAYAAAGGIHTAIAHSAETVFQTLSPRQQSLARTVFLRLVEIGWVDEAEMVGPGVRRRANMDELRSLAVRNAAEREELAQVINLLVNARLVTVGQDTVEVTHEALIQEWPTLRHWLQENRDGLVVQQHLIRAVQNWENSERESSELYRGLRLQQALEWATLHTEDLTELEWEFLRASQAEEERQSQEREQIRQRQLELEHRARQRLQIAAGVLFLAVVVTSALAVLIYNQRQQALRQASIGLSWAALEQEDKNPELALLLSIEALEAYPYTSQAHQSLAQISQEIMPLRTIPWEKAGITNLACMTWSPDGALIACVSDQNTENAILQVVRADTREIIQSFPVPANATALAAFAPGNQRVLLQTINWAERNGDLLIVDLVNGEQTLIKTATKYPGAFGWAGEGEQVYAVDDQAIHFWDAASGLEVGSIQPESTASFQVPIDSRPMEPWNFVEISPDGQWMAVSMADGALQIFEPVSGELIFTLDYPQSNGSGLRAHSLHWSPDGKQIAALYALDGTNAAAMVLVWDVGTQSVLYSVAGSDILMHSWLPAQDALLIFKTGSLVIWDRRGPRLEVPFPFSFAIPAPDGSGMLEFNRIWDLGLLPDMYARDGSDQVHWSGDGSRILTMLGVYEVGKAQPVYLHPVPGVISPWSPDSTRFVHNPGRESAPVVVDGQTGSSLVELEIEAPTCPVGNDYKDCLSLSNFYWFPDGTRIIAINNGVGEKKPAVYIWDAATGRQMARREINCNITSLALSSDASQFAVGCAAQPESDTNPGQPVQIWDLAQNGEAAAAPRLLNLEEQSVILAWSPDGQELAAGYTSGKIILWDVQTGEPTLTFAGHNREIASISWSPDGKFLLSVGAWYGEPARALVWSAEHGEIVQNVALDCGMDTRCSGSWSPDGEHLLFNNMLVYRAWTDHEQLLAYVRETFSPRELTSAERALYGLSEK